MRNALFLLETLVLYHQCPSLTTYQALIFTNCIPYKFLWKYHENKTQNCNSKAKSQALWTTTHWVFYLPNPSSIRYVAESFNSWSTRPKGTGLTSISSRSGKKWFNFQWISQPSLWLNLALKDPKEAIRLNETTSHLSYLYPTPFSKVDIRFSMDKNFSMEVIIGISLIQFL